MTTKITKILIANRGEIACRVIRTARKMGIATVAVYSDADRDALHVRMADEAVHIGPSPAAESYLVIDKIIGAATHTGADAIHPGYGFLSENPAFVRACQTANITFIGPSAEAMEAMGLKDAAKSLMTEAGVPVTPGYQGDNQDADHLAEQAAKIGYPVLIKAVAGGGGKGMRKVEAAKDFKDALASAQRESASSFGNDVVLIEKYIQSPRHIEVQVFGDALGNVVHMFERDCSLQRRHQKVIEEAPAPGMTDDVRAAMTSAAVRAAQAVNYQGAGTVEFIVDGSGALRTDGFWFMEMNTRLQVEHPVTEMITGLDLVEWQIRVAQGEALPDQSEITLSGHAVEARLYAEDPANDFAPSIGQIRHINADETLDDGDRTRVDTGIDNGDRVTVFYDPMIAKAIAHSGTRFDAIVATARLIDEMQVSGVKTNAGFLIRCLMSGAFANAEINTNFIADHFAILTAPNYLEIDATYASAAMALHAKDSEKGDGPFDKLTGWRLNLPSRNRHFFIGQDGPIAVDILRKSQSEAQLLVDGRSASLSMQSDDLSNSNRDALHYNYAWDTLVKDDHVSLTRNGDFIIVPRFVPGGQNAAASGNAVIAPMSGKVISVLVEPGATVTADQPLVILEAMKMEMTLKSPRDGVVADVTAVVGVLVDDGQALVTLDDEDI
ncbi:MAG: acetyl/propionyl/methylcrotonyl-CoA carboxylase subunit alpha [Litorimonas sp.]